MKSKNENFSPTFHQKIDETGYVRKSAVESLAEKQKLAELAKVIRGADINAMDLLHEDALAEKLYRESEDKKEKDLLEDPNVVLSWIGGQETRKRGFEGVWYGLKDISPKLLADRDFAVRAIPKNQDIYAYLSKSLRADKELASAAIDCAANNFGLLSETLRGDKDFVLRCLRHGSPKYIFSNVSEELKKDKKIILTVIEPRMVGPYGGSAGTEEALQYADPELLGDKNFIFQVIEKNPECLEFVSDKYKKDTEVVMAAIKRIGRLFKYADASLRKNADFIVEIVGDPSFSMVIDVVENMDERLRNDEAFILKLMHIRPEAFYGASDLLTINKDFAMRAIAMSARNYFPAIGAVKRAGHDLKAFSLDAVRVNPLVLREIERSDSNDSGTRRTIRLSEDLDFVAQAVKADARCMQYIPKELKEKLAKILEKAAQ